MSRPVGCALLAVGGFALVSFLLVAIFPIQILFDLAFGWILFLWRVVPTITVSWSGVATAALCLGLFVPGLHAFLKWLAEQRNGRPWLPRWTASVVALVLLMFVAGLAAGGVAHQLGWIVAGREPFLESTDARGAVQRIQSTNNLKQIGIGLQNYQEMSESLPPGGAFDRLGQGQHGWQTFLMPFVELRQDYDQINFALPWDHSANAPIFQKPLSVYQNPAVAERTDPRGYGLSHYTGNARLLGGDVPRSLSSVPDGTSQTILAGEVAGRFVPWGAPTNWRDPALGINRDPRGLGSPFPGGANILMADGSVKFVKDTINPQVLRALSTPDGGETIDDGAW